LGARSFLLFLSRIHEKKGVDILLDAYAKLVASAPSTNAFPALVVAGPCADPEYLDGLRKKAAAIPAPGLVLWPGMLQGDAKWGAFRAADAFVLPSHQENFGIAVAEALACGAPVLISNQVNIWREVEAAGAALVGPDTADGTYQLLSSWLALSVDERARLRQAAEECFASRFEISRAADSLLAELAGVLDHPAQTV
jgi:glycosyltransferase involved in cell wall biosynthesis